MNWRAQLQSELDANNALRSGSIYRRGDKVSEHNRPMGDELHRACESRESAKLAAQTGDE